MTTVLLNAEDVFGRGISGTVEARPWAGDKPYVVVDGEDVTMAHPAAVSIRDGEPVRALTLDPSGRHPRLQRDRRQVRHDRRDPCVMVRRYPDPRRES